MKLSCLAFFITLTFALTVQGQSAPDAPELTKLLNEFLAATTDPAMHERFWADDLIYTRSAGLRISKSQVIHDIKSAPAPKPGDSKTIYSAEDVRIQQYGDTAIVAFRLVGTTTTEAGPQVSRFLNSGTFLKRNGKWQVVNWQATRMARSEEESKREVTTAGTALFQSLLAADVKRLSSLNRPNFHLDSHRWSSDVTSAIDRLPQRRPAEVFKARIRQGDDQRLWRDRHPERRVAPTTFLNSRDTRKGR